MFTGVLTLFWKISIGHSSRQTGNMTQFDIDLRFLPLKAGSAVPTMISSLLSHTNCHYWYCINPQCLKWRWYFHEDTKKKSTHSIQTFPGRVRTEKNKATSFQATKPNTTLFKIQPFLFYVSCCTTVNRQLCHARLIYNMKTSQSTVKCIIQSWCV